MGKDVYTKSGDNICRKMEMVNGVKVGFEM